MILIRVDLPAPLSPRRHRTSPRWTSIDTSVRTWVEPKDMLMSVRRRMGAAAAGLVVVMAQPLRVLVLGAGLFDSAIFRKVLFMSTAASNRTPRMKIGRAHV